jgi:ABC-type transporter Mla subunit MlaD
MPSLSERQRNNVKAGLFVTVTLFLGLAVIVVLGDVFSALGRGEDRYTVTFDVQTGVAGLKVGSDVRVGGVKQGRVVAVEAEPPPGQPLEKIQVVFDLNNRIQLYKGVVVSVVAPLIGADAWLEIPDVGHPDEGRPDGTHIIGASAPPLLTGLLGPGKAEMLDQMFADGRDTLHNARVFSEWLPKIPDEYGPKIDHILQSTDSAVGDAQVVMSEFRENRWPDWSKAVDAFLANAVKLSDDLNGLIAENRPKINTIVSDVEGVTNRLRSETIEKFDKLVDSGQSALDSVNAALNDFRADYADWATSIGEAMASANLASQQLKLTTIEVRRSPWKLLYRPDSKEVEHELLYEATRSFAVAAADLKASSLAVQRIMDMNQTGSPIAIDQATAERLRKHLLDSLERYEIAQQQLTDVLLADHPSSN